MQRELYEERLVDAKKKASDEYFLMQADLQVIREELEASEQQSKVALDELRMQFDEKDQEIKTLKNNLENLTMDYEDLNMLCQKQLEEIQRLN